MIRITPTDILDKAFMVSHLSAHSNGNPGDVIKRLKEKDREILKNLKSGDISNIRVEGLI